MNDEKETTALNPSAPTDEERSSNKGSDIISYDEAKINGYSDFSDDYFDDLDEEFDRMMNPYQLNDVSLTQLYDMVFDTKPPLVENLLYRGVYLLCGAPKLGKSFLVSQLAYHVSTGEPLWGFKVNKGTTLYMDLEDDLEFAQQKMFRMFGANVPESFRLVVQAGKLGDCLESQIDAFIARYPDTSLIVIDTLQKVRGVEGSEYS